jgi:hypothetical protein
MARRRNQRVHRLARFGVPAGWEAEAISGFLGFRLRGRAFRRLDDSK